jgi:hypothetical protein
MATATITDEIVADLTVLTEEHVAEILTIGINTLKSLRRKGIGPRVTVLSTGRLGYRAKDVREWLDARAETQEIAVNHPAEAASTIADEAKNYLRCQMNRDPIGWAKTVNASRYPVKMHFAALCNALARLAEQADDPEQFLDLIAEVIRRD